MNINNIHDIFFQNNSQTEAGSRTTNVKTTFDTHIFTKIQKTNLYLKFKNLCTCGISRTL